MLFLGLHQFGRMDFARLAAPTQIICIGASAGGLGAVSEILRRLPSDPGVAIIVVQRLPVGRGVSRVAAAQWIGLPRAGREPRMIS